MPAHHLNSLSASQVAGAVLVVLAGTPVGRAAAELGVETGDLDDAVTAYQAAGLAALERRAEHDWYYVRVEFLNWDMAEDLAAGELGPRLCRLERDGVLDRWWFLRKHPHWRLRLQGPDPDCLTSAVNVVLGELVAERVITRWQAAIYEPETLAFGGPVGIQIAHDLFCADRRGVLSYLCCQDPSLGRREISMLLASAMLQAAGLDWFERGDVFDLVAQLRPALTSANAELAVKLATSLHTQLTIPVQADSAIFANPALSACTQPWAAAFSNAGHALAEASAAGTLQRGLRAILSHLLIFHWNRLGLPAVTQTLLARAATVAILTRSERPMAVPKARMSNRPDNHPK
jgi:thiopeptide-type bacteriocin biosynthesis protein